MITKEEALIILSAIKTTDGFLQSVVGLSAECIQEILENSYDILFHKLLEHKDVD